MLENEVTFTVNGVKAWRKLLITSGNVFEHPIANFPHQESAIQGHFRALCKLVLKKRLN